jgi:hypothetical protein
MPARSAPVACWSRDQPDEGSGENMAWISDRRISRAPVGTSSGDDSYCLESDCRPASANVATSVERPSSVLGHESSPRGERPAAASVNPAAFIVRNVRLQALLAGLIGKGDVHRTLQTKFAASFVLPTPVYCATCG